MVRLFTPDDTADEAGPQSFATPRTPHDALDAAETYLEGAGIVAPALRGRMVRTGNDLVVHYGRVRTHVTVTETAGGSDVHVTRRGRAPLDETRRWMFGLGLAGFVLAWALAWYNTREDFLPPLVTITLYFLGLVAVIVGLYVIDRSLEHRGTSLLRSLEDAMQGDPIVVLQREIDSLERGSAIANAVLFFCASIIVEFIVFVVLLVPDGVRKGINEAVTLDVMRAVAAIPVVPAILFGIIWFYAANRLHGQRLALVERRLAADSS